MPFYQPDTLPPGVALIKDLAPKYGVTPQAIRHWIQVGRMEEVGRVRGQGSGGRGYVAVKEADVIACYNNPRKGGRPRKKPDA